MREQLHSEPSSVDLKSSEHTDLSDIQFQNEISNILTNYHKDPTRYRISRDQVQKIEELLSKGGLTPYGAVDSFRRDNSLGYSRAEEGERSDYLYFP